MAPKHNTYRIYWPDLDDYSSVQSNVLDWVIQHGINCGMPFVIEGDLPWPYCLFPKGDCQGLVFAGETNELCIGRVSL